MICKDLIAELLKHDLNKEIKVKSGCYEVEIKTTDITENDKNVLIESL